MSLFRELSYDGADIDDIKSVQFCLIDPEEVKRRSVVHVQTTDTYVGNEPVLNGLYDPRMGVTDASRLCGTCEQRSTFCPGHFGHIEMAQPVFYYQYMNFIKKILQCVCIRCSKLMYAADSPDMQNIIRRSQRLNRWNNVHKLCSKINVCGQHNPCGCGARNPDKITKNSIKGFVLEWKPGVLEDDSLRKQMFGAPEILEILKRITNEDVEALGMSAKYSRPEWMICTVLPVPPPAVRPCVHHDTGQRQEDDLSYTLSHIIKNNNSLAAKIKKGDRKDYIDGYALQLQYYVATLVENQIQGLTPPTHKRSGRTLRSLSDRLKGKEGRIRGNLMGKRVDFSARSVITPDPNISIDEVGVPMRIAMNLTFPEVVSELNKTALHKMVLNGPDVYPGAKMVRKTKEGGRIIRLKSVVDRGSIKLDNGDIVERHLMDGDYVLFNRQPSLHRMSMMGHRVRVMPFNTFRISTSVCTSFNADFDGDEMNMHVPQSHTTAVELEKLASVNTQIISPKDAQPIISIVQDTVLGVWRLSRDGVLLDKRTMCNMLAVCSRVGELPEPGFIDENDKPMWTGKQLLSTIIPPNITLHMKNKSGQQVSVVNGQIQSGTIDKTVYQKMTSGLVHSILAECGPLITRDFFDDTQKLVCAWLVNTGFSVGVSDLIVDEDVDRYLVDTARNMKQQVYNVIDDVHAERFNNPEIMSDGQYLETLITNMLNKADDEVSDTIEKMISQNADNRMLQMVTSGAKGGKLNIRQMTGFLGQQNIEGQRVPEGFENRTLPHFTRFDDGPDARGWVQHSFFKGLSPVEYFFHAMGGREGLIDTAVKSVTGDTPIVIIEDGIPRYTLIGEWIDSCVDGTRKSLVQHFPEDRNMEFLELDKKVYIPTCDSKGVTSWGELTAVTRHDPGERLYKITTLGGRTVTVAESRSLIVWDEESQEFKPMNSPDVKEGDFVPVNAFLPESPISVDYVDMTQYFPRSEYLYGTDFNLAWSCMKQSQGDRFHIPKGWWAQNNGTTFTLPYPSKSRLQRVTVRSCTSNIRDGCVYPLRGMRDCSAHIPEKFDLNYENGVFIGLFLADGNTDTPAGSIQIAKEEPSVQDFVRRWFDMYSVTHRTVKQQKQRGFSHGVIGSSMLLAKFLDAFVGNGARYKYVPDIAFVAPLDFVKGILSGYFSGDGHVRHGGIVSSSVSKRLTEGISMLCTRLGIFGKVSYFQQMQSNLGTENIAPIHNLSIRAQWAEKFRRHVELISKEKQLKLHEMKCAEFHRNFTEYNDVVMDEICSIQVVSAEFHRKLYDVTVPSTLNFSLANGLESRDTSEVGYVQRKLVKAMEDCKVHYDMTVRNAGGQIIQFLYGEDGMDSTRIEKQKVLYSELEPMQFAMNYCIGDPENEFSGVMDPKVLDDIVATKGWKDKTYAHFMQIVADRELLFAKLFPRGTSQPDDIFYPIAFNRILEISHSLSYKQNQVSDLSPLYVIDKLNDIVANVPILEENVSKFFGILLRMYLSPKRLILKYHMRKEQFDNVIDVILKRHDQSYAHAGEMVGVIAAQSIGEPATQLTLNSVHYDTMMLLNVDGGLLKTSIGDFVHGVMDRAEKPDVEDHPNDTKLAWIRNSDVKVLSCDENGKIDWQKVEAVTRHPVVNEDGSSTLLKVTLDSGRQVVATKAKSFLTRQHNKIVATNGSDLKVGDYLPVSNILPVKEFSIDFLDVSRYLPKREWLYISEVNKALDYRKVEKSWFRKGQGVVFEVPYSRGDALLENFVNNKTGNSTSYSANCVYPRFSNRVQSRIPEIIPLDEDFGFFCGAYLAEGCVTSHHVLISNVDDAYNAKIIKFCERYNIKYHEDHRFINNGVTHTIRMHSIVLTVLITKLLGRLSNGKKISAELYAAPDDFLRGLIDGYFSGDGSISKKTRHISSYSTSIELLEDLRQILVKYGIHCKTTPAKHTAKQLEKFNHVKNAWVLSIPARYVQIFCYTFKLTHNKKQSLLEYLSSQPYVYSRFKKEYVPDVELSDGMKTLDRHAIPDMIQKSPNDNPDKEILQNILQEDILYDKIVSIEELNYDKPYVYDLTVENTRTFCQLDGSALMDTFHSSGSRGSDTVRGVPRIRELLSGTRRIKTPSMTIVPEATIAADKLKCLDLLNRIQVLRFDQVVSRTRVFYDPTDAATKIKSDEDWLREYGKFSELDPHGCITDADPRNPWLLRVDINREALVERGVSMMELADALIESQENRIRCVYSDESNEALVFRIRLDKPETEDVLTELRALESHLMENLVIWGLRNVSRVTMRDRQVMKYDEISKVYQKSREWLLYTDGTEFRAILGRMGVDQRYTVTNDVVEVYDVLGVEAARQSIINEFNEVMVDSGVNFRHISMLVDNMTHRGRIVSVDRFGINRSDIGVLSKASFEESVEQIITSAVFAEKDPMNSIAANVMLGQIAPCGTGQTEMTFNMKNYLKLVDELGLTLTNTDMFNFEEDSNSINTTNDDDPYGDDVLNKFVESATFLNPSLMRLNIPNPVTNLPVITMPQIRVLAGL